jgi:hypothetical protein
MEPGKVIDHLGGTKAVAELCETSESAVSQWRTNGIPKPRLMFLKLARPDLFSSEQCVESDQGAA